MSDPVTVVIDALNPPFSFADGWELSGYSVDVIRDAFARVGHDVSFCAVEGPLAQLMWLAAGRVRAAADITVTERRTAWFDFSTYYHVEELMIFGRRGGPIWPGFRHFTGKLAVKANSYGQEYLIRHHPSMPLLPVDSTEAEVEALMNGRVEGFVTGREAGLALISHGHAPEVLPEGAPFGPAPVALAALHDDAGAVLASFNEGFGELLHSGRLDHLRERWLHAFAHA